MTRTPVLFRCLIVAAGLFIASGGHLLAQTDTTDGSGAGNDGSSAEDDELRSRIGVLESRQGERLDRELESARSQLRAAKQMDAANSLSNRAAKNDRGSANQSTAGIPSSERWRYTYHQGRWWYWLPSHSWAVYQQGRWVRYDARPYGRYSRRKQAVGPYSSDNRQNKESDSGLLRR